MRKAPLGNLGGAAPHAGNPANLMKGKNYV
jgi:hypothetical protein